MNKYFILGVISGVLVLGVVFVSLEVYKYKYEGYYSFGKIILHPAKTANLDEYLRLAEHEWAHYYMDKLAVKGFLLEWKLAVDLCGVETEYAMTYKSRGARLEEEWAECFSGGSFCCAEKMKIVEDVRK